MIEVRRKNAPISKIAWEKAWDMQIFARLYNPAMAQTALDELALNFMLPNYMLSTVNSRTDSAPWFDGIPLLQVDASLGLISAITDCIVQDRDALEFLPALPDAWHQGNIKGICVKGGIKADASWSDNRLNTAVLYVLRQTAIKLKLQKGYAVTAHQNTVCKKAERDTVVALELPVGIYKIAKGE